MTYTSLTNNGALRFLHYVVVKLKACVARVTATNQSMVTIDFHQGATTRAHGSRREQLPITPESTEVAAVDGLLLVEIGTSMRHSLLLGS